MLKVTTYLIAIKLVYDICDLEPFNPTQFSHDFEYNFVEIIIIDWKKRFMM